MHLEHLGDWYLEQVEAVEAVDAVAWGRSVRAAQLLGGDTSGLTDAQARDVLPQTLLSLMRDTDIPNGLGALGFGDADVAGLVDGALKQQRLLVCCPRDVGAGELEPIVRASMQHWP